MIKPAMLIFLVPIAFGIIGGVLAANRGRNFLIWGALSVLFPIFILIVWFEKPLKEVEGHFKRCSKCHEWIKCLENPCRYCGSEQTPR
jgi:hypothetical protein